VNEHAETEAVELENCKVDECGLAVHEECYVAKVTLNGKQRSDKMLWPSRA
jgi:hypothetical protein